ncbi:MAG: hypothetical protein E7315_04050 [Clostridiales bacterium]|nr:hypothetical protein [Clostridiales bacterium]
MRKIKIAYGGYVILLTVPILLCVFPLKSTLAAKQGLEVWVQGVVPSLFPFTVLSRLLVSSVNINRIPAVRYMAGVLGLSPAGMGVVATSMLSGYPTGARLTASLKDEGYISADEAEDIACASSFCSPAFAISYVAGGLLGNSLYSIPMLISHYVSMLLYIILFVKKDRKNTVLDNSIIPIKRGPLGKRLLDAVNYGCTSTLAVGGYIVLFYVFCTLIRVEGCPLFNNVILAVSEISMGARAVSELPVELGIKISVLTACISWGGACVIMQSTGFMLASGISCRKFIWAKIMQAFLAGTLAYVICLIFI